MNNESSSGDAGRTQVVRDQGRENGLFRACMDQIRSSHTVGQTLRNAAIAAGLLTDAECYAELLGQFYVVTAALEVRIEELVAEVGETKSNNDDGKLVARVAKKLGYSFTLGYERDLNALLGKGWRATTESWTTEPARRYARRLETASDAECAAAAFILHGPLAIGGGAMLKPRVERAFGEGATNVFRDVTGTAKGGRSARRRDFVDCYDTLLDDVKSDEPPCNVNEDARDDRFETIVDACGEFMQLNNEMMLAVRQVPWWRKYVAASVIAAASTLVWRVLASDAPTGARTLSSNNTA